MLMALPAEIRQEIIANLKNDRDGVALSRTCKTAKKDVDNFSTQRITTVYGQHLRAVLGLDNVGPIKALRALNQRFGPAHQFLRIMFLFPEQAEAIRARAQTLADEDGLYIARDCAILADNPRYLAKKEELEMIDSFESRQVQQIPKLVLDSLPDVVRRLSLWARLDAAVGAIMVPKGPYLTSDQLNKLRMAQPIDWTEVDPKVRDAGATQSRQKKS